MEALVAQAHASECLLTSVATPTPPNAVQVLSVHAVIQWSVTLNVTLDPVGGRQALKTT